MNRTPRIVYVVLSPTFGMHQYAADLAAQTLAAGCEVHLVTTRGYPADRYQPAVTVHTPVLQRGTGFNQDGMAPGQFMAALRTIRQLRPTVVHFAAVHLWNPLLLIALRGAGIPAVHTLHDLEPHPDVRHGGLIRWWNRAVIAGAAHLLVHAAATRRTLLSRGVPPAAVTAAPLSHSFLGWERDRQLQAARPAVVYEPWVLFFGRLHTYKGLDVLLRAAQLTAAARPDPWLVLAGAGDLAEVWPHALPPGVVDRRERIDDATGWDYFRRCSLLVLPYTGASQSALPAAAYAFAKPTLVSDSGALPEVVIHEQTGWVTPAGDAAALAEQLRTALRRPHQIERMGRNGRAWYEAQRCAQAEMLATLYRRLASQ